MSMDPIVTRDTIRKEYNDYLSSILAVRNPEITRKATEAVRKGTFVKGPYLEATPPFVQGKSLHSLFDEGIVSGEFSRIPEDIHYDRPLYAHQELALRKICGEQKNVIVATGTGSGKTECYFYPIFNELMRQEEAGTLGDGVQALLLFPMNALANDQQKKLRQLLKNYPQITFGRYTGETPFGSEDEARSNYRTKHGEDPLPNEMLSRERMQKTPPHILLTNYAMLEYLLLRPADSTLFDGCQAKNWRFVVIDEAHTYRGANGAEIALLLRRLKERIGHNTDRKLRCIATSATLGSEDAKSDLCNFAANLFGEPFYTDDIVTSLREEMTVHAGQHCFTPDEYRELKQELEGLSEEEQGRAAFSRLRNDRRIVQIHEYLKEKPRLFDDVAEMVFPELSTRSERLETLALLVELATLAKPDVNAKALLPARYHLFAKSLEGLFVSLYPDTQTYLDRKEVAKLGGRLVPVFELANCQRCGQEYIVGITRENRLKQINDGFDPDGRPEYFLLNKDASQVNMETDEDEAENSDIRNLDDYWLCTACGALHPAVGNIPNCCDVSDPHKHIKVYKISYSGQHKDVNTCVMCGGVSKTIIKRFLTANHAATYTLASSLYGMIPPRPKKAVQLDPDDLFFDDIPCVNEEYSNESGRKLLIFSDNRQEAAFFAGFMGNKHNQLMWRRLILRVIRENGGSIRVDELIELMVLQAEQAGLYENLDSDSITQTRKKVIAGQYVMYEFLGFNNTTGLEGRGYVEFIPEPIGMRRGNWGLSVEDTWNVLREMMDTLRLSGASSYPDNVDPKDEFFAPRNRKVYFRKETRSVAEGQDILSYVPASGRKNRRLQFLLNLKAAQGIPDDKCQEEAVRMLDETYNLLIQLARKDYFTSINLGMAGVAYMINFRKWKVRYIEESETIYRCSRCGKISAYTVKGVCSSFKCNGTMEPAVASELRADPYYHEQYAQDRILPMVSREHTAQLTRDAAGDYQRDFEDGKINVLSCSTTFEMGVDVGELEATFLRNVPPETANYIQRAGRAGRRTSSTAFSLTFSRRNSHDINYFNHPEDIISGRISPPYVEIYNEKIAARHINSVIMSWFFKNHPRFFEKGAAAIVGYQDTQDAATVLRQELAKKPADLLASIKTVLPEQLVQRMQIDNWIFVDQLVGPDGSLTKAIDERAAELKQLDELKKQYIDVNRLSVASSVDRLITTYTKAKSIDFLASHTVLPKYGFPVDVVPLKILNNSGTASQVELTRDLRVAIAEYAPPSSIVANGKVWTSRYINTVPSKGWPTFTYYSCKCGHISPPGSVTVIDDDLVTDETKTCPRCAEPMKRKKFLIPIFGFSTSFDDKPAGVGESRPQHGYTTRSQFWGIGELDEFQKEQRMEQVLFADDKAMPMEYTPNGRLVVLNQGKRGAGLFVCKSCGCVREYPKEPKHNNRFGKKCLNTRLEPVSLGHWFETDIVRIELPYCPSGIRVPGKDVRLSVLYAILDGAAQALGISRSDISGCIDYEGSHPAIILFDEAAGGAGHVKKVFENFQEVLRTAMCRVDGSCGCSEETSCYGCLRNYGNQYEHDSLTRGGAYQYLRWLLNVSE